MSQEPTSAGQWKTVITFRDGCILKERALLIAGAVIGTEARIFNSDGTLRPLRDGKTSYADTNPGIPHGQ